MKVEIKEILSLLNSSSWSNEAKQIEDYITNLQTIEQQYSVILSENAELKNEISELMKKYKKSQRENERLKGLDENYPIEEQLEEALKYENIYKSRIDKANECIKENTRWFDSEYAKVYGELCDCEGAKGDRLEVLVNPSNLSKILGGDDNEQI